MRTRALRPDVASAHAGLRVRYDNARKIGDGTCPPALEEKAHLGESNCPEFPVEMIDE